LLARGHYENGTLAPNTTIWFDGSQSWDYGLIYNPFYAWYWGDGTESYEVASIFSHVYANAGTYNVTLLYADDYTNSYYSFPVVITEDTSWYIAPVSFLD